MTRWLVIILAGLGLGAAAGQIENLDGTLPIIGQVLAIVAIVVLGVWRGLPDRNADRTPDLLERWPRLARALRDWVVPVLLAIAAALGVATVEGCGGLEVTPRLPGYEVSDSEDDDDLAPDRTRIGWTIETNQGVNFRAVVTQGFSVGSFPAWGCIELLDSSDRWIRGWCYVCNWSEGFTACRLVDQPAPDARIESGEGEP